MSAPDVQVYDRDAFPIRTVAVAVASQIWQLLALVGVLLASAVAWFISSGYFALVELALRLCKVAVIGLLGSFALHESAHVVALRRIGTVTHLAIDRKLWRVSIIPLGTMTGRQVAGVALAGPLACVAVGLVLRVSALDPSLTWWYLAHGLFLLPSFGDGRSLWGGLRGRGLEVCGSFRANVILVGVCAGRPVFCGASGV